MLTQDAGACHDGWRSLFPLRGECACCLPCEVWRSSGAKHFAVLFIRGSRCHRRLAPRPVRLARLEPPRSYPQPHGWLSLRRISTFRLAVRVLHSFSSENSRPPRLRGCPHARRGLSFLRLAKSMSLYDVKLSNTC